MKTVIYYFSGSGNSLAIAKRLASELNGPVELLAIAGNAKQINFDGDVLGIAFPVYFQSIPDPVRIFLKNLYLENNPYIFAVATCNGSPGHSLFTLNRLLKRKGLSLALGFVVDMPGNSVIGIDLTSAPELQEERLAKAAAKLPLIVQAIEERREHIIEGRNSSGAYLAGLFLKSFVKYIYKPARQFWVSNECTHCGTCGRVCPAGNITMNPDRKPVWGDNCKYCLACIHWCPRQAIELRQDTVGKRRYHHPEIIVDEMINPK